MHLRVLRCFVEVVRAGGFSAAAQAVCATQSTVSKAVRGLEEDCGAALRMLQYRLKLLEIVGYLPKLKGCGRCGRDSEAFHLSHGAVLCEECSGDAGAAERLSPGVITLAGNLLAWDPDKIGRLKPHDRLVSELSHLLDEHVRYVTERQLRTRAFTTG